MRAADHDYRARRTRPGVDRNAPTVVGERQPFSAAPDDPAPSQVDCGCCDNADERRIEIDQCDIDREFVTASNELSGPVERIDQKIGGVPRYPSLRLVLRHSFLRD